MNATDANASPQPQDSAERRHTESPAATAPQQEAGVPRKFGVGVLLVITAMYALLFRILRAIGAPPSVFFVIVLFFTTVGLAQMLLYGGRRPRRASVLAGSCFLPGLILFRAFSVSHLGEDGLVLGFVFGFVCSTIGGALLGYVGGAMIAAVFLVIDNLKRRQVPPTTAGNSDIPRQE